jgi:Spy/CpxP family protein refolding chaperone
MKKRRIKLKKIEKQVIEIMEEMRVKSLKIKNILKPEDKN